MVTTSTNKMIPQGLMLMLLMIAQVSAHTYPPILRAKPEQIHIAYGTAPTKMLISWSQKDETTLSFVEYGLNGKLTNKTQGVMTKHTDEGSNHLVQYECQCLLEDLVPGEVYTYVVGNEYELSERFSFQAMKAGDDWSPSLVIYGDMGNTNAVSLERLQMEADKGMYDAIIHVGDFAYNMWEMDGQVGDEFMRMIQPLAANLPYMTCPGNHEYSYNFSHYKSKFHMPGDDDGNQMYFSFDMGPVHFVSISTEWYWFYRYGLQLVQVQYNWLIKDLKEATKPENRAKRPWIVVYGHRPMYCTNIYDLYNRQIRNCSNDDNNLRKGLPPDNIFGLEDVLYDYGVDLAIWAHEHSYERLFPLYKFKMMNGSYDKPYTNPRAPVHIITGSGGCRENTTSFMDKPSAWSAFQSMDYGYTRMNAINKTHLYLEQVSDNQDGKVIDKVTIIKNVHAPYEKTGRKRQEFSLNDNKNILPEPQFQVVH